MIKNNMEEIRKILDFLLLELKSLTSEKNIPVKKIEMWGITKKIIASMSNVHGLLFCEIDGKEDVAVLIKFRNSDNEAIKEFKFDYPFFGCKTFYDLVKTLKLDEQAEKEFCTGLQAELCNFCLLDGFFKVDTMTSLAHPDRIKIQICS